MQIGRRLSDKIVLAFNQACDQGEQEAAEHLLRALELVLTRAGGRGHVEHRSVPEEVLQAYERLEALKARTPA